MIYFINISSSVDNLSLQDKVYCFDSSENLASEWFDTTKYRMLNQKEIDDYLLQNAKDKKLAELEALFEDTLNTKIINVKYIGNGSTVINSEINLKIDDKTTSELGKIKDFFDLNPTVTTSAFGDAILKTTKIINKDAIKRYSLMSAAIINLEPNGLYPKRRAIKSQINALTSIGDVNNFNIVFK